MRTRARSTGVPRLLLLASAFVLAWLAFAPLAATSALAHAGHRHAPAKEAPVSEPKQTVAPETHAHARGAPSSIVRAELPDDVRPAAFMTRGSSSPDWVDARGLGARDACLCGWACGACASMTCCHTALAPSHHLAIERPVEIAPGDLIADRLGGAIVVPLPRPPDFSPRA